MFTLQYYLKLLQGCLGYLTSPTSVNTLVLRGLIVAARQYCNAFRIQYDSNVARVDTRPPTATQTALQPRAQESLEMLCIIHAHTHSICPNTHFLVSVWNKNKKIKKKLPCHVDAWHGAWFQIALRLNLTFTLGLTASSRNTYCRIKSSFRALCAHSLNRICIDNTAERATDDKNNVSVQPEPALSKRDPRL